MVPTCIANATSVLSQKGGVLDRETVVAYSVLDAFQHHFPSQVTPDVQSLLERFAYVREEERSRWMKQRRIAISEIMRFTKDT